MNENIAVCKLCTRSVSAKGGTTSNLISHLKLYHPSHYRDMPSSSKQSISVHVPVTTLSVISEENSNTCAIPAGADRDQSDELVPPVRKRQRTMLDFQPLNSSTTNNCTLSVTKFLAATMQPYNLVEHETFIDMINTLNPRYTLPSRKYFSKNSIPKLYNDTVEKIKYELALIKTSQVSVTTDCWTSIAGTPYVGVTCHFIDAEWGLKSFCLRCAHFEKDHTSDNIAEELTNILSEWSLDIKELASCTTDNGKNIVKDINELDIPHVSCFGHNINIGVNRALQLPQLRKAVSRLKKLQNTIAHSWKMQRDLSRAQELLKMDQNSLPSACETRWWSTFKLCQRFLTNQLALCKVLQDHSKKKHLMPEGSEVSALEDFVAAT